MKKIVLLTLALMMALTLAVSASADTVNELQAIAQTYAPAGAVYLSYEMDDGNYEFKFWAADTQEMYEIKMDGKTRKLLKFDSEAWDDRGSAQVTLTESKVREKVEELFPGATILKVKLDNDDGLYAYEVEFKMNDYMGEVKLDPETGEILKREFDYAQVATASGSSNASSSSGSTSKSSGSSASSGSKSSSSSSGSTVIGTARAKEIAISRAGGGKVTSIRLTRDDGRQVYDGKVVNGNYEYEFEIDALNGSVREWDKDRIEKKDNNTPDNTPDKTPDNSPDNS